MRRLDSRLIYGGEDSGTFSVTYRPIFFVKKLVGQLTVLNQEFSVMHAYTFLKKQIIQSLRSVLTVGSPKGRL